MASELLIITRGERGAAGFAGVLLAPPTPTLRAGDERHCCECASDGCESATGETTIFATGDEAKVDEDAGAGR